MLESSPNAARNRTDTSSVLRALDDLCSEQKPGAVLPSQAELRSRFNASERAVRQALDELQRQGKVVQRQGARTYVADWSPDNNDHNFQGANGVADIQSRTVVTISAPDGSIFDRALQLLARHPEAARLAVNCRLIRHGESERFELPGEGEKPLGYILFSNFFSPLAQKLQADGHRVVLIGSPPLHGPAGVPNVYCDHEEGGELVVRHLLELGHRRILFQGSADFEQHPRWRGALRALNSGTSTSHQILGDQKWAEWIKSPELVRDFFAERDAPTALVAWNDHRAVQLLTFLNHAGLRVPNDVSLVGYDDLPQSATLIPALTTVDSFIERQLNTALRLLTQPEAASPNHTVVVLPSLVRRDSSAPPAS